MRRRKAWWPNLRSADDSDMEMCIEHPNGTKTKYARLENLVVPGDYVAKGSIAVIGNTGLTTVRPVHRSEVRKKPFVNVIRISSYSN